MSVKNDASGGEQISILIR